MSILNTSVSGMQANSNWLSTISQNVANSNTTGYKNVETDFSSLVDQIADGDQSFGGVSTRAVSLNALQGNVVSTSTATDLAVQGSGFFVVSDSSGTLYLTRNGSFTPDASGNLVNSAGYYLMAAERPKWRLSACRELADRSREGQCRQRRADRDRDHLRLADRQSAVNRVVRRVSQSAIDQFCKLDLYRCDIPGRL